MSDPKKIRLTVDLTPKQHERLSSIETQLGASSKADVVRSALLLYEYLVRKTLAGCEFQFIENGQTTKVVILA